MGTVENLASVDTRFTIGIGYAGAVADETAFLNVQPINVQGWERMTRGQRNDLLPKAEKDCIGINQKCFSAVPNKVFKCDVKLTLAAGITYNDLKTERIRRAMNIAYNHLNVPFGRIGEETDGSCSGYEFAQHLESFGSRLHLDNTDSGDISTRPVETFDKPQFHRVGAKVKYYGNRGSRILSGFQRCVAAHGHNHCDLPINQLGSEGGQSIKLALRPAEFHRHVLAFNKANLAQASANRGYAFGIGRGWRS